MYSVTPSAHRVFPLQQMKHKKIISVKEKHKTEPLDTQPTNTSHLNYVHSKPTTAMVNLGCL